MASYTTSQFIQPFDNKPTASPDQTIGQVLEYTYSSHMPIYIFDEKKYIGVVSAYQSFYHNFHTPYTKKVLSELIHTPRLTKHSSLFDVMRSMMDTRLYELPIVDKNDKVIGVVTANDIIKTLAQDDILSTYLIECVDIRTPVTHNTDGTVEDIYHTLRKENVSRIVLTDSFGKVAGIVTRSDIKTAFIRPNLRQRFRGKAEEKKQMMFDPKKNIYCEDDPIARYAKENVETLADDTSKREILQILINSDHNSIVLVNELSMPTGFISTHDIVHCLGSFEIAVDTPIIFEKPNNTAVPELLVEKAQHKLEHMIKKLSKIQPIEKIDVAINEQKFANQKVAEYKTRIVISIKGKNVMTTAESKEYVDSVQNAISQAEQQFIKNTKHTYHKSPPSQSS